MGPRESVVEILHGTGFEMATAEEYAAKHRTIKVGEKGSEHVEWGWVEEQKFFIKYPKSTSDRIETLYQEWRYSGFDDTLFDLDLESVLGKARSIFDFAKMAQINFHTNFERSLRREVRYESHAQLPSFPLHLPFFDAEAFLPTFQGQVIHVTKEGGSYKTWYNESCNVWYYGDVVYDPAVGFEDRPKKGWFPAVLCEGANWAVIGRAFKSRVNADILKPPVTWETGKDGLVEVAHDSQEYRQVVATFTSSFNTNRTISSVERVQSLEMWRTYAAKCDAIRTRYRKDHGALVNNTDGALESLLFHGTDASAASKIVSQGFNRAYAGRNGATFGKGVYFSSSASYSERYAGADSNSVRMMFLCRVAHGDYCTGRSGMVEPDPKPGRDDLFDSAVDNVSNPKIFVVYHDAQVYPEYLVTFHQDIDRQTADIPPDFVVFTTKKLSTKLAKT